MSYTSEMKISVLSAASNLYGENTELWLNILFTGASDCSFDENKRPNLNWQKN